MDLNAFREETRDWLESNCPESMRIGAVHFEDAYELSLLLSKNVTNAHVTYYDKRSKKINSIIYRSKLNYFSFHLSNSLLSKIRNYLMKTMTKNKKFLNLYLGKVYN